MMSMWEMTRWDVNNVCSNLPTWQHNVKWMQEMCFSIGNEFMQRNFDVAKFTYVRVEWLVQ